MSFNGKINFNLSPKGDVLALLSAICWGFYSLFLTIINKKGYNTIAITRKIFFYAILFMLPLMIMGLFSKNPNSAAYVELSGSLNAERFSSVFARRYLTSVISGTASSAAAEGVGARKSATKSEIV